MRKKLLLSIGLSLVTALLGLSLSYPRGFNLKFPQPGFFRIATDGWLVDGSRIELPALARTGNFLNLSFDSSRAAHAEPTAASILVCGKVVSEIEIAAEADFRVPLDGDCEPRNVEFKFAKTFSLPRDGRALGARLSGLSLSSPIGLPLVRMEIVGAAAVLLAALSLAVLSCIESLSPVYLVLGIQAAFLALFRFAAGFKIVNIFVWWWLILLACAGWRLGRGAPKQGAPDSSQDRIAIIIVLIAAGFGAWLRFRGLNFGLPDVFHPDEGPKAKVVARMIESGSLNPHYFLHPSLLLYLTLLSSKMLGLMGLGSWSGEAGIVFAGRLVSCISGILSIPALYFLTRKSTSALAAAFAASLLAVLPLHAGVSRYLKEDALLILIVLLSANFIAAYISRRRLRDILWASIFAGLAMGVKYTGAIMFGPIALAAMLGGQGPGLIRRLGVIAAAMCVSFLAVNPFVLLSFSEFALGFSKESLHMVRGHGGAQISALSEVWIYHLRRSLPPGMGFLPLALGLLGLGFALRVRGPLLLLPVVMLLAFYLPAEWVKAKPFPQADRYIAPCLPFLAMLGAFVWDEVRRRAGVIPAVILAVAIIAPPLSRSVKISSEIREDTRIRMAEWIRGNLPEGARVLVDWDVYGPPLRGTQVKTLNMPLGEIIRRLNPKAIRDVGADYIVLSSLSYGRFFLQPRTSAQARRKFREFFSGTPIIHDEAPKSETYGFHNPRLTLFSVKDEDLRIFRAKLPPGRLFLGIDELARIFPWSEDSLGDSDLVLRVFGLSSH